ncbi:MAG TPA: tetratricopeptide repeat protein [Bryobacteraceae bacterium]|jgi:Flp pilus assembly protein TadD|nr:tetratricopeptide repeat protein [Bryobacteraceae bacterium]
MSADSSIERSRLRNNRRQQRAKKEPRVSGPLTAHEKRLFRTFWIYAVLLLATITVYGQVRHFDFVNYDDPEYVTGNSNVLRGLTPEGLAWAATSGAAANWLPLTRVSHMLDIQLFGLDSGLHHLTNLMFHALSTLLLFAFLNRATGARGPSAFVAFVFALHPLHVESVTWIAERKDVLSAFFWCLALLAYVRYTERPAIGRYLLVLFLFCCGLMAKPMTVTLPFALWLLDIWPLQRLPSAKSRLAIVEKLPFLVLSIAVGIITFIVQQGSRAVKPFPLQLRIGNALLSYVTYIDKTFWPSNLAVFYPYRQDIPAWKPALAGLMLLCVSVLVVRTFRSRPYLAVGWFWYLGTLLPVIGLIQVGAQARADRYTYIPMIGLSIMLAWGAVDAVSRWPRAKGAFIALAAAACASCAVVAFIQVGYWRNSETLFAHALQVTRNNYVAHHNYGLAIAGQPGRLPEAMVHYRDALEIQPRSVEARTDLGSALAKSGHFEEAIAEYKTALQLAPDCTICRSNLDLAQRQLADELFTQGVALAKSGHTLDAIGQFEAALRLEPADAETHNNLGVALATLGRTAQAIQEFRTAVQLKPDYPDARYNLAAALSQSKQRSN